MRSLKEWQIKETAEDAMWQHIKTLRLPVDPNLKGFISPKIGRIQEAIVHQLNDPKVKSFRDIPAHLRDSFAKAIVGCTLELFFSSAEPASPTIAEPTPKPQQPPPIMPQDEPQSPVGSKG